MTIKTTDLTFELRKVLLRSIGEVLDEVLNLPHWLTVKNWRREDLLIAIARSRAAIGAVRLYASEFSELPELKPLDQWSRDAIAYAGIICDEFEEEVTFIQAELLAFAQ